MLWIPFRTCFDLFIGMKYFDTGLFHVTILRCFGLPILYILLWGQRTWRPRPTLYWAQGPRRGEKCPRTCAANPNGLDMLLRTILSSASQTLVGKNGTPLKATSQSMVCRSFPLGGCLNRVIPNKKLHGTRA